MKKLTCDDCVFREKICGGDIYNETCGSFKRKKKTKKQIKKELLSFAARENKDINQTEMLNAINKAFSRYNK